MNQAWIPSPDEEVVVEGLGAGRILEVRRNRALVSLNANQLKIEIELEQLSPVDGAAATTTKPVPGPQPAVSRSMARSPSTAAQADLLAKRSSVEALRFGLVPSNKLEQLTLGFDDLKAWIISRLPHSRDNTPQVAEICGLFGSGKSHTMAAIRYVAEQEGYVTAKVEVDGLFVSLSDPERLLYSLWSTFRSSSPASSTPLFDMCVKAIQAGRDAPWIAPRGIDRVRDNYSTARLILRSNAADSCGHVLDAVMASSEEFTAAEATRIIASEPAIPTYEVKVRRMIGRPVADRSYDFIEAWIGYAAIARLAGYRGLVLTIDEFEVEHLQPGSRFQRVADLLDVITKYFKGDMDHPRVPLGLFIATVGEEGHAGDKVVDALIEEAGGSFYPLEPWDWQHRAQLARRIHDLYCDAYDLDNDYAPEHAAAVEKQLALQGDPDGGVIRAFIKGYLGVLDSLYGPVGSRT